MLNPRPAPENPQEPAQIREWSKSKLYSELSETYLLPSKESRGVTRSYLVRVFTNQVYRVERVAILQFETHLTVHELKKAVFFNVNLLVDRLERLMAQLNLPALGFGDGTAPEEDWFRRILRYVDPTNILQGFKLPVHGYQTPHIFPGRA